MAAIFVLVAAAVVLAVDVLVVIAAIVLAVDVVGVFVLVVVAVTVISAACVSGVGRGGAVEIKESKNKKML